jgi:hypothetical protein
MNMHERWRQTLDSCKVRLGWYLADGKIWAPIYRVDQMKCTGHWSFLGGILGIMRNYGDAPTYYAGASKHERYTRFVKADQKRALGSDTSNAPCIQRQGCSSSIRFLVLQNFRSHYSWSSILVPPTLRMAYSPHGETINPSSYARSHANTEYEVYPSTELSIPLSFHRAHEEREQQSKKQP